MEEDFKKVERKDSIFAIKESIKGPKLSDFEFTEGIQKIYEKKIARVSKKKNNLHQNKIKRKKKYGKLQEKSTRMLKNMFY